MVMNNERIDTKPIRQLMLLNNSAKLSYRVSRFDGHDN